MARNTMNLYSTEDLLRLYVQSNEKFEQAGFEDFGEYTLEDVISFKYKNFLFVEELDNVRLTLEDKYRKSSKSKWHSLGVSKDINKYFVPFQINLSQQSVGKIIRAIKKAPRKMFYLLYVTFFKTLADIRYLNRLLDLGRLNETNSAENLFIGIFGGRFSVSEVCRILYYCWESGLPTSWTEAEDKAQILSKINACKEKLTKVTKIIDMLYKETTKNNTNRR